LQSKLGEGAVGVVYSAEDLTLGRNVALKFLSSEFSEDPRSIERLKREARTASLLSHPHICTIYEIEQYESAYFIAMELLEGQTLEQMLHSGPLELPQVLRWGVQACRALEAAAERGIVHRDLKPANIFITKRGAVKLLDFGLAMIDPQSQARQSAEPRNIRLTFPGLVVGTVAYMSPEQACGEGLDIRSDLFSLGVVLYELATGELPFRGAGWNATIEKILHSEPATPESINPDLPPSFGQVIGKCLQKLPQDRYQTPNELAEALQQLLRELGLTGSVSSFLQSAQMSRRMVASMGVILLFAASIGGWLWYRHNSRASGGRQATLAVMPFQYLGDDSSLNFLELALPDQITNVLTHVSGIAVRPFESARRFAGADDPQTVGRALGVRNVLSGRYWVVENEITITLELVDVDRDRVIWEDTLAGNLHDQPALRSTLATSAREQLLPAMGVESAASEVESQIRNPRAYELYLHAIAVSRDPAPNLNAIALLERAVQIDPQYAPAWDELGERYYYDAEYGNGGGTAFAKAFDAYQRAAQLDPNLIDAVINVPELLVEKGELYAAYDQASRIVASHPGNPDALFGLAYILRYGGDLKSAGAYCDAAAKAAPGYYTYRSCARVFMEKGEFERARQFASLDSGSQWFHNIEAEILVREGKPEQALAQKRIAGSHDLLTACLAHEPAAAIEEASTRSRAFTLLDPGMRYNAAAWESYCGRTQQALELLQQAVKGNYCSFPALDSDPLFEGMSHTPGFSALRSEAVACSKKFLQYRAATTAEAPH
jgi:non-specific serine/threonine protein kinase